MTADDRRIAQGLRDMGISTARVYGMTTSVSRRELTKLDLTRAEWDERLVADLETLRPLKPRR